MKPTSPCLRVLICARNEAEFIDEALERLLESECDLSLQVLVILNGSTDDSRSRAERWVERYAARSWRLEIHEPSVVGKPAALRYAASLGFEGPTLLLDARIAINRHTVGALWAAAQADPTSLLSATLHYLPSRSLLVDAFSRAYGRSPYARSNDLKGTCVLFSRAHVQLLGSVPDIGSDDRYFLSQTPRENRGSVPDARAGYRFPEKFVGLIKQQIRWRQTNLALDSMFEYERNEHESERRPYFGESRPDIPAIAVYFLVGLLSEAIARVRPDTKPAW